MATYGAGTYGFGPYGVGGGGTVTQVINESGTTPSFFPCSVSGDQFVPGRRVFLHLKNGGGADQTVTVAATGTVYGDITLISPSVTVPAGGEQFFGPFPPEPFLATDGSGVANITYSDVTSLTFAVYQLEGQ